LAFLVGGALAVAAFKTVRYIEDQNVRERFHLDAQDRINAIKREIEANLEAVQNLYSFYEGSEKVTREEFHKFTAHLLTRHPSIRAFEWIPRVPLMKKNLYEEEARARFPDFRISEREERGILINAQRREEYFPVYYVEPLRGNEAVLGFDVASEPTRLDALKNARDSGLMAATVAITLVHEQEDLDGFLVFIPVYQKNVPLDTVEKRRKNLLGFVVGVIGIGDMVDRALTYLKPAGINIYLDDASTSQGDIDFYKRQPLLNNDRSASAETEVKERSNLFIENSFQVADKTWKVTGVPVTAYSSDINDLYAWAAFAGILFVTFLITVYLKKMLDQAVYSEGLVRNLGNEINVRREVADALKKSEKEFRALFENMNEAFAYHRIIVDETNRPVDYEFILVNHAFEKATGLKREDILGKKVTELIPGIRDSKPDLMSMYGEVALTGKDATFELHFEPFNKWFLINAYSPRKDHFVALFDDITERKKFELERERLLAELSSKNRELEQVLYVTSHDLRAPLVNIEGFGRELQYSLKELMNALEDVEMSSDTEDTVSRIAQKEVPESMAYISASIVKMASMLRGLLKLSRLGRHELRSQEIDMNKMFADVITNFEFKLKNAEINVNISDVPPCRGDSGQINQIFSNLIDNAINHLDPARPGIIKISGRREKHHSIYSVEDNGIGIHPDHQEKIFELFQQLEPGSGNGEGLGLTIAHRIVERHHGKIWVESEPGKGSRFYVELPA